MPACTQHVKEKPAGMNVFSCVQDLLLYFFFELMNHMNSCKNRFCFFFGRNRQTQFIIMATFRLLSQAKHWVEKPISEREKITGILKTSCIKLASRRMPTCRISERKIKSHTVVARLSRGVTIQNFPRKTEIRNTWTPPQNVVLSHSLNTF